MKAHKAATTRAYRINTGSQVEQLYRAIAEQEARVELSKEGKVVDDVAVKEYVYQHYIH